MSDSLVECWSDELPVVPPTHFRLKLQQHRAVYLRWHSLYFVSFIWPYCQSYLCYNVVSGCRRL